MIGVELFAGAGGLSLGAQKAGITISHAIESAIAPAMTYKHNHRDCLLVQEDIRRINPETLEIPNKPKILFGGPPCQGFSTSNQKTRNLQNQNNWLFKEFIRFVNALQPDVVVFENVAGIIHTEKGFFLNELTRQLEAMNYHVTSGVINAISFGVPQQRNRFFCIGSRKTKLSLPKSERAETVVTVREAISDLPKLSSGNSIDSLPYQSPPTSEYARNLRGDLDSCTGHLVTQNAPHIIERYKHIPQGGNWSNIPKELMGSYKNTARCHTGIYKRLHNGEPSVVLGNFRKNMLIHPIENRGLSIREAARIQSFPDNYEFLGSIGQRQQQVGNAVPPLMAYGVFKNILDQL